MFLYCISNGCGHCKFGYSVDPHRRLRSLQTGQSNQLTLLYSIAVDPLRVRELERILHSEIGLHRRVRGEWFAISAAAAGELLSWFEIHYLN
jgi:T5orf172 domain.